MDYNIPLDVREIIEKLEDCDFEAYTVGGCVRDTLLGKEPNDWDICTSAIPEQVQNCFSDEIIHTVGIKHGTILLVYHGTNYEITTFRIDKDYRDHRHPEEVEFSTTLSEDLKRRDFTINSMALHPTKGLIDLNNGQSDLKAGVIKCVGDAESRFEEDALRILRALRFSARYGFDIERNTANAMLKKKELLKFISQERIFSEIKGFLEGQAIQIRKLLLEYREIFAEIFPELRPMFDHKQYNPHHCYDIWTHTCYAVSYTPCNFVIRFAMLFHDSGKPHCFTRDENGIGHFSGHPDVSAKIAESVLNRLHCDTKTKEQIIILIKWHDRIRIFEKRRILDMLRAVGEENSELLFDIFTADCKAQHPATQAQKLEAINNGKKIFESLLRDGVCYRTQDLAINGQDIIDCGIEPSKQVGDILDEILNKVMYGELPNDKSVLIQHIKGLKG